MSDQYSGWLNALAETKENTGKCNPCPKALRRAADEIERLIAKETHYVAENKKLRSELDISREHGAKNAIKLAGYIAETERLCAALERFANDTDDCVSPGMKQFAREALEQIND